MKNKQLSIISEKINSCSACSLYSPTNKHVSGFGNPDSKIVFMGEAPGEKEAELGQPFVGRAGKMLDGMLSSINLSRNDVFIINPVCCRPPNNRKPFPNELSCCKQYLIDQLNIVSPDIIVALGNTALGVLTGRDNGIVQRCGKWETTNLIGRDLLVMPCFHPSGLLRNPKWKEPAWHAFQAIAKKVGIIC